MINAVDWWKLYAAGWQTAMRVGETLAASNRVIDSRTATMRTAAGNPAGGDYRELARMVPEKVDAFGRAGASITRDMGSLQAEVSAHLRHVSAIMARGGIPTAADIDTMVTRGDRVARQAMSAFGRALSPVHATATANAKRLGRPRPR